MKILIAPAPFKGTLTAPTAAALIHQAFQEVWPEATAIQLPIADGGDGTLAALVAVWNGSLVKKRVHGPLGTMLEAEYGISKDGMTAIVEMAQASGLSLVPLDARNPMLTTTLGTGELIRDALANGVRKIILGVGGSATSDAGLGMAKALGIRFLDENRQEVRPGAQGLADVSRIELHRMYGPVREAAFEVACDATNPLLGPEGAAAVYGPQKGASAQMVIAIEQGLEHVVKLLEKKCGKELAQIPGTGAGGGIVLPLLAFAQTQIHPGSQVVFAACELEKYWEGCNLVITGEGRLDGQSMFGKAPVAIAREAKKHNIPVIALCGTIGPGAEKCLTEGITAYFPIVSQIITERELSNHAAIMLKSGAMQLAKTLKTWRSP